VRPTTLARAHPPALARASLSASPTLTPPHRALHPSPANMSATRSDANCIFCKIIAGQIPSFKLIDTDKV